MGDAPLDQCPPVTLGKEFEEALIGFTAPTPTTPVVAIYDLPKVIDIVAARDRVFHSTAHEWVKENFLNRYWGTVGPIFRRPWRPTGGDHPY